MNRINQPNQLVSKIGQRTRQSGVALPLVAIGLIAMMAMVGLAVDSSHAFVNMTRMQNTSDAAALAAAKVYDQTADTVPSTAAANSLFGLNTDGSGNFEIDSAYDGGSITVVVQYSQTLNPFVPSGIGPYVRVIANGFDMATGFISVIGITSMPIAASAVAGPSPTITNACNIAPILVCANEPDDNYYGFDTDKLMVLKPSPGDHDDVGPGNYKLLRLDCPGGDCIRDAMGGSYDACASTDESVDTEPGVTAGPTSQGFNTRFGIYNGPVNSSDYPPDVVVEALPAALDTYLDGNGDDVITLGNGGPTVAYGTDIPFSYSDYVVRTAAPSVTHDYPNPVGAEWRRILALPVADCSGDESGQSTIDVIGFACYFMLQPIGGGTDKNIFGQFVDNCLAGGLSGPNPGDGRGPYRIQLYKDPDSGNS